MSDLEADVVQTPPVSIGKRIFLASSACVLLLAVAGFVQYALQRSRNEQKLKETLARLDESDPGWRLDQLDTARPDLPEADNSARTVVAAHRLLPRGGINFEIVGPFFELPPPQLLDPASLDSLETQLKPTAAALVEARRLSEMPAGRHFLRLNLRNPYLTLLPDQQGTRGVATLLRCDALHLAQKGESQQSLRSCRAALNAARSIGDEPFIVSQLIRIACVNEACTATERTLALGTPPADDLARLQKLLQDEEMHPGLLVALRGERAAQHITFTGLTNGSINLQELGLKSDWQDRLMGWRVRDMARRAHPHVLELMGQAIANARLPLHEQAAADSTLAHEFRERALEAPLVRLLFPAPQPYPAAHRRKIALTRCTIVLLAVERHRQATGIWPARLEELAPKLLSAVPLDPFDGKTLRYRRLADGVVVYSVGQDGTDDGGNLRNDRPTEPGVDLGYRLWDVNHRRQPPLPSHR